MFCHVFSVCSNKTSFPGAVTDFRASLVYKQQLYSEESEILAEAHFKLSLALEFASITRTEQEGDDIPTDDEAHVDQGMRDEAVKELEAALNSTNLKLQSKEVELASSFSVDDNEVTIAQIANIREIMTEMENRVSHLY